MKKKIFGIPIVLFAIGIIGLGTASAALLQYFGAFTTILHVESPITVSDASTTIEGYSGEPVYGNEAIVTNHGDNEIMLQITTNEEPGVNTFYVGKMDLVEKVVDFNNDVWDIVEDGDKVTIEYVMAGKVFSAEVIEGEKEGYVLIYYKDNSDRFNNPSEAILTTEVTGDLPYETDGNANEYDYCETGEYDTCHGAKIWYVPESAINPDKTLDWSRASEFLFESELIQSNMGGEIMIYPHSSFGFSPVFELDPMYYGTVEMTTIVDLAE